MKLGEKYLVSIQFHMIKYKWIINYRGNRHKKGVTLSGHTSFITKTDSVEGPNSYMMATFDVFRTKSSLMSRKRVVNKKLKFSKPY